MAITFYEGTVLTDIFLLRRAGKQDRLLRTALDRTTRSAASADFGAPGSAPTTGANRWQRTIAVIWSYRGSALTPAPAPSDTRPVFIRQQAPQVVQYRHARAEGQVRAMLRLV